MHVLHLLSTANASENNHRYVLHSVGKVTRRMSGIQQSSLFVLLSVVGLNKAGTASRQILTFNLFAYGFILLCSGDYL
jgi:hypothetical protein